MPHLASLRRGERTIRFFKLGRALAHRPADVRQAGRGLATRTRYGSLPTTKSISNLRPFTSASGRGARAKNMSRNPDLSEFFCTMLRANRAEIAQELLTNPGFDVHHRTNVGQTPLHIAAGSFMPDVVAMLIARGADTNALDDRGTTPLMNAAKAGDDRAAEQLFESGAKPNLVTRQMRWTALMFAARYRRIAVLERLIANGADPELRDRNGHTAADIARKNGLVSAVALLGPGQATAPLKQFQPKYIKDNLDT